MKKIFFLIYLLFSAPIISQQFHSLDGYVNIFGDIQLVYRLGGDYYFYNPIYKLNLSSSTELKIMDAYHSNYPGGEMAKAVLDFKFFPDDYNFINCGFMIYPDNHGYAARNDSIVIGGMSDFYLVDISHQNYNKTYVSNLYQTYRSFDGGFTYPLDSLIDFPLLSVAEFDDRTFFGLNDSKKLIKSFDNGMSSIIVDDLEIFYDRYFDFKYDQNHFHIYMVNRSWSDYKFSVSNNKGTPYTWTRTYESINPLFIANNQLNSGVIYLADWKTIYRSTNNGYTFTPYRSLESKIVGICEPAVNMLYAATKNKIYEITSDSIRLIKSLPIAEEMFSWFPLAVGNKWIYNSHWIEENSGYPPSHHFVGTRVMQVQKDTAIKGKMYYVVLNDLLNQIIFKDKMYLRIDSSSGNIYQYWQEFNAEYLFHNLNAEVGDTVYSPPFPYNPFYILTNETPILFLDSSTSVREYREYLPCSCGHNLIKGFGLARTLFNEFGVSEDILKGCVLNGIVLGDTSFVVSVKDENEELPVEFKLNQNYPNPFNPSTRISWQSPVGSHQSLKVYDVLGNEVATLVDEYKPAGRYEVEFNPESGIRNLASGIYFYQLRLGDFVQSKKMLLLK